MPIAKRLVLKANNPTAVKVNKLYALAEELGISISFNGHRTVIEDVDRDRNLPTLYMEDIETGEGGGEFPPTTEYRLVYDNPQYLAQLKKENEEYQAKQKAAFEEKEKQRLEEERQSEELKAKQQIEKDLAELERLKEKYGNIPFIEDAKASILSAKEKLK